ncbi:MAG TPA: N-acetyltransferase [Thermodesulfobacteriota bacterium]|nr:N-acetyltransferase [Deltaproteobacteria bacterium]HQU12686.1 N-acetyltransferase [Thermodesulfobacteriota bacterium]
MIRKARMSDVKGIHRLIADYAKKGDMLPRSLADIYENLRDYFVFEEDDGELVGSAAIHIMWEDLAEVRSLAVREGKMRRGVGTRLVESCISEAIVLGIDRVFALTYKPEFFKKLGFHVVDKAELPQKIWSDCLKCSKFPDCDEVALVADFSGRRRG